MVKIFAVKLKNCIENLKLKKMESLVSLDKQKKIKKYLKIEDAYRTLIRELLIKKVAVERLQINNQEIKF